MTQRVFLVAMSIAVALLSSAAVAALPAASPGQVIVVASTADSGSGTLREAIARATSRTTITFDRTVFPLERAAAIALKSPLPTLAQGQVTIDGSGVGVILDGSAQGGGQGFHITSDGNVIKGLQILHFPDHGIWIEKGASENLIGGTNATPGAACSGDCNLISGNAADGVQISGPGTDHNLVLGNWIGTDATGAAALGNGAMGVAILEHAQHNVVGGDQPGQRNIISGNADDGVFIHDIGTMYNTVRGNYIGTNASGTSPIPNGNFGVNLGHSTQENLVGGFTAAERNVISGNRHGGVNIAGTGVMYNVVSGNYVGTDVTGTAAIGNAGHGITFGDGVQHNRVGGATSGERNVISGNGDSGVTLESPETLYNTVIGNFIGTDASGTRALGNERGVTIRGRAGFNTVGGAMAGEGNVISGNRGEGVVIYDRGTIHNTLSGNYVGTDASGAKPLGNERDGVSVSGGALQNIIGPGNVIAYNGQDGVRVRGSETLGIVITGNSIHDNESLGIRNAEGGNGELPPPAITRVGSRFIAGTAPPKATVEVFSGEDDEGRLLEGEAAAGEEGTFTFRLPAGRFTGSQVTATARDAEGNTSGFSSAASPPAPVLTSELPGIVAPTQVSVEPEVVGTNLGLALFCVLFFGLTSTVFNSILDVYRDEMVGTLRKLIPRPLTSALHAAGSSARDTMERGRWWLLFTWLFVLFVASLIESFLEPEFGVFSPERLRIFITLFISAVAVGAMEFISDLYVRRRLAPTVRAESKLQWIGILIAVACVAFSRALQFRPGYLYGMVGAMYLMPDLEDITDSGRRALFVLLSVFSGGIIVWLATAFLPAVFVEMEPLLLTIFLIGLQGVFFSLFPLAITDGGDIWSWRRGVWVLFFSVVFFCFYHFLLNPSAAGVQALQQNGVRTLLILILVFGLGTLALWLLFPLRLGRKRGGEG